MEGDIIIEIKKVCCLNQMTLYEAEFLGEKKAVSKKRGLKETEEPKPKRVRKPKAAPVEKVEEVKVPEKKKRAAPKKKAEVSPPPSVTEAVAEEEEDEDALLEKKLEAAANEAHDEEVVVPKKRKATPVPKLAKKQKVSEEEPPAWFKKWNEAELRKSKTVPRKQVKIVAAEESTKQWNDGHTRDKVRHEMDNHQSRMFSAIFGNRLR